MLFHNVLFNEVQKVAWEVGKSDNYPKNLDKDTILCVKAFYVFVLI